MGVSCSYDPEHVSWHEFQVYVRERDGVQNVCVKRHQEYGRGRGSCGPVKLLAVHQ